MGVRLWCDIPHASVTYPVFHTRAGMIAYRKMSSGTTVEVADEIILPVDGFGTIEVNLDKPSRTTTPVKMVFVTYVPGLSRNMVSNLKAVEKWGKPPIYYKAKAVLSFPREETLVFNFSLEGYAHFHFFPPQGIIFRNRCKTDPGSRGDAGGGGESTRHNRGTPYARAPERGDNVANG